MTGIYRWKASEHPAATGGQLIRRAEDLIPTLRARTDATDAKRSLTDETRDDLKSSGIARLLQPVRFGGAEAPISAIIDVLIPIAGGCPSTAWCLAQYIMHNYMLARWPAAAQERIWQEPDALVSGIIIPRLGRAVPSRDGYLVSGTWPLVSGVEASDWCMVTAMVERANAPDEERYFLLPTRELTILDTWHSIGLKGSGSQDITLENHFIPEHMSLAIAHMKGGDSPGAQINPSAMYRLPTHMSFGLLLASAVIGIAESMFETFLSQSRRRRALMSDSETTAYATHHMAVGDISASLQAAEALLRADAEEMMDFAQSGHTLSAIERSNYRCNAAFAGRLARSAAEAVWDLTGARGTYQDNPIARLYQDVIVASRHTTMNWQVNSTEHGRTRLRLPLSSQSL
ncbi:hypothetical protein [Ancylobacter sp. G4_0304]|uniref:hypothetical protein n=1 Tax=Ancylobacter sp. G4_0304 TaxID=3114289 RepID=UPI0039C5C7DD